MVDIYNSMNTVDGSSDQILISESQGHGSDFLSNTIVVPNYESNSYLQEQIAKSLNGFLYFRLKTYQIQRPKLVIFRTGNRPGEAFVDSALPILKNDQDQNVYLIVASKVHDQDISELIPEFLKDDVVKVTIKDGKLVGLFSSHYYSNKQQLLALAKKLSRDFSVPMRGTCWLCMWFVLSFICRLCTCWLPESWCSRPSFSKRQIICLTTGGVVIVVVVVTTLATTLT